MCTRPWALRLGQTPGRGRTVVWCGIPRRQSASGALRRRRPTGGKLVDEPPVGRPAPGPRLPRQPALARPRPPWGEPWLAPGTALRPGLDADTAPVSPAHTSVPRRRRGRPLRGRLVDAPPWTRVGGWGRPTHLRCPDSSVVGRMHIPDRAAFRPARNLVGPRGSRGGGRPATGRRRAATASAERASRQATGEDTRMGARSRREAHRFT